MTPGEEIQDATSGNATVFDAGGPWDGSEGGVHGAECRFDLCGVAAVGDGVDRALEETVKFCVLVARGSENEGRRAVVGKRAQATDEFRGCRIGRRKRQQDEVVAVRGASQKSGEFLSRLGECERPAEACGETLPDGDVKPRSFDGQEAGGFSALGRRNGVVAHRR